MANLRRLRSSASLGDDAAGPPSLAAPSDGLLSEPAAKRMKQSQLRIEGLMSQDVPEAIEATLPDELFGATFSVSSKDDEPMHGAPEEPLGSSLGFGGGAFIRRLTQAAK
eukprot:7766565-Alexandrium_andersonii.AAC.1